jgi:hypothetical protein
MNPASWDNRFYVSDSKDNGKVHEFFRQYFDKPSRRLSQRISLPANPGDYCPSLASTLEKFSNRIPKLKKLKGHNRKSLESGWNTEFQVKVSKDNSSFYNTYREYFDTPKKFDHNASVVRTIPASAHGYKRNKNFYNLSAEYTTDWTAPYAPISENNSARYKTLRKYFDTR